MAKPSEPPGKPPKAPDPPDGVVLTVLEGPWGRVALRSGAVTSLRSEPDQAQTHVGLPSGETPVYGTLEAVAEKLGLGLVWAPDPEPEPKS